MLIIRTTPPRAVYGKTVDEESGLFNPPTLSPNLIPKLKPEFFSCDFFHRFSIQREFLLNNLPFRNYI